MKVIIEIGTCKVLVDDGNSAEPATIRWKDQFEKIQDVVEESVKHCIAMHAQQAGDIKEAQHDV